MEWECRSCKYWEGIKGISPIEPRESRNARGTCKRFPPVADSNWPKTQALEWCWEYTPVDATG